MQVLLNTDNHIRGSQRLTEYVESTVHAVLGRLEDRITRVEVTLTDENSRAKSTELDKRCTLEARLAGREPIVVRHDASTIEQAVEGAVEILERTIERTLGRLENPKGRTSMAGEDLLES